MLLNSEACYEKYRHNFLFHVQYLLIFFFENAFRVKKLCAKQIQTTMILQVPSRALERECPPALPGVLWVSQTYGSGSTVNTLVPQKDQPLRHGQLSSRWLFPKTPPAGLHHSPSSQSGWETQPQELTSKVTELEDVITRSAALLLEQKKHREKCQNCLGVCLLYFLHNCCIWFFRCFPLVLSDSLIFSPRV